MNFHKAIFLIAIFLILIPYVGDNDFWLHLRAGEIIVENGYFPKTDVLSFTNEGKEWVNHAWLFQVISYSLFKYGGFATIPLFTALVGTIIFALIAWHRVLSWPLTSFLWLLAYGLRPFFVPRPQIFAYLILPALILSVSWYYKTRSKNIIFVLPLILFLWSNVHASVILGLPILLAVLIFEFAPFDKLNFDKLSNTERRRLLIGTVLAAGASLANPFGYKIYWHALHPLRFSHAYNSIIETQPIYDVSFFLLCAHLLLAGILLWGFLRLKGKFRPYEALLWLIFVITPFLAVKYLPFAWMLVFPLVVRVFPGHKTRLVNKIALVVVLLISVGLFFLSGNLFKSPHSEWPERMIDFVRENNLTGNIYNPFSWSGYISWSTKRQAFNNPTIADLGGDTFWDSEDFEKGERIEEIIKKYDLSIVIAPSWLPLPYFISLKNDWALVYWDNFGTIFVKRGRGNDKVIGENVLDIKYFNDSVESVLKKYKHEEIPVLIKNYEKAIERQPDLLLAHYRLGLIYQLLGYCPKAVDVYNDLLKLDNKLGSAHFRLAECYQGLDRFELSVKEEKLGEKYVDKEKWWSGRR